MPQSINENNREVSGQLAGQQLDLVRERVKGNPVKAIVIPEWPHILTASHYAEKIDFTKLMQSITK